MSSAAADEAALNWKPLNSKPAAHRQLIDCRSPTFAHEARVKLGDAFKLGGHQLTFSLDGDKLIVAHQPPGEGKQATRETLSTPPVAYYFSAFETNYGLSLRLDTDRQHLRIASLYAIEATLGNATAYLVDSNLDSIIGNKGDGLLVPETKTVAPLPAAPLPGEIQLWSRSSSVTLKHDGERWFIAALPDSRPAEQDHSAAWRQLQWQRQASGLLPLRYDGELEKGMKLHIAYLIRNNRYSHYEYPEHPGYTQEGAKAGMTCVVGNLKKSYVDGVQSQLLTMFHRGSVLSAELDASAMVLDRGFFMCSTKMHLKSALQGKPVVYPAHGMTNVPCEFNVAGESPVPFEGEAANNKRGTAISVRHAQLYYTMKLPTPPVMTLEAVFDGDKTEAVDCDFFYPGKPPRSEGVLASNLGHVALVPKKFLKPKTMYRATVTMPVVVAQLAGGLAKYETFSYTWEFTTGESKR